MNSLLKLEDMGYVFEVDGEDIIFDFKSGKLGNPDSIEQLFQDIKREKFKVIDFLKERNFVQCHKEALKYGYLPYANGECYGKQVTEGSEVFIQLLDDSTYWTAYRATYRPGDSKESSSKTIIESSNFHEVIKRLEKYVGNFKSFVN